MITPNTRFKISMLQRRIAAGFASFGILRTSLRRIEAPIKAPAVIWAAVLAAAGI